MVMSQVGPIADLAPVRTLESAPAVSLRHVGLYLSGEEIIHDISFEVPQGAFVCLFGPSGCGKSTTLRLIGGLLKASRGAVSILGLPPDHTWQHLAYVFQAPRLVAWRTALENVILGMQLRTHEISSIEMRSRAFKYLQMVGLVAEADKFPGMLSGGQRQRVALARALAVDPDIILMDEPFAALDLTTRKYLRDELLRIWRETKKTVIFVTHDLEEAIYLSDMIVIYTNKPASIVRTVTLKQARPRNLTADNELRRLAQELHELFEDINDRSAVRSSVAEESYRARAVSQTAGTGWKSANLAQRIVADGFILLAFIAWYLYSRVVPDFIIPNPFKVLTTAVELFSSPRFVAHTYTSFARVVLAVVLSLLIGGVIVLAGWCIPVLRLLVTNRIIPILNAFPSLGWAMLAIVWFGVNNVSVMAVEIAILLPFSMINLWEGVKALDSETLEMARSFTTRRTSILVRVILPLLFPFIFSAVRMSYGVAWKVALIAEVFGAEIGLGHLLNIASQSMDTTLVFATIIALIVLVIGVERLVFDPIERIAQRQRSMEESLPR
jgi:NitT/TauT family transport system ATP-binding protein